MKIYIIRHGETALNAKGVMQGRIDEPLNENGGRRSPNHRRRQGLL
jgi:broad specificity phosphatase PhoE